MNQAKTSILASFATIKILNDTKRYSNAYQILSEFINYIIYTQKIYTFTSIEMKNYLKNFFDFDIPEAVVKTASKSLPFVSKEAGTYIVDKNCITINEAFEKSITNAETTNTNIIDSIAAYIEEKIPTDKVDKNILTQDFIAFIIDDQQRTAGKYTGLISEFILKNENNNIMQNNLRNIQEGCILYIGLNFNINETGSINKKLTLFLDMEVLFSIIGFNGTIHKRLADDFLTQVNNANSNGRKIFLRYFSDVKKEIDSFFDSAAMIASGKMQALDKVAMKAIVDNCVQESDVIVKKSDFYHDLQYVYGIIEDNKKDYYTEENNKYNLESIEYTDPKIQSSWKYISHINKLRKGSFYQNNIDSGYILITNTRSTLNASKEQLDKDKLIYNIEQCSDYALSVGKITNILWYKLGNGFGKKEYPTNVDTVLRARIVLAANISHNVTEIYNEAKEMHKNGKISSEQLAARIIMLRNKPLLPEELEGDSIEDSMDFSSDYVYRFEQEINENKAALEEKDREIEKIKNESQTLIKKKDEVITKQDLEIIKQNKKNQELTAQLKIYKDKENYQRQKKEKLKYILKTVWSVVWRLALVMIIGWFAVMANIYKKDLLSNILAIGDILALFIMGHNMGKSLRNKKSKNKND